MSTIETDTERPVKREPQRLDESQFIRARLFQNDKSAFQRYCELVLHRFSWLKLIRYELLVTFVGPLPGALGLVLRRRLLRRLFRRTGKGIVFGSGLTLRHADRITLGDDVVLDNDCVLDAKGAGDKGILIGNRVIISKGAAIQAKVGNIEIGNDCSIGARVDIISQGAIIIENSVSVAGRATIAGGRYVVEQDEASPGDKQRVTGGVIRIGRNSRIGMGAIIQDGVTIGENAIVAPGAVVFEDVPANTVVWGNPASPVRHRRERARGDEEAALAAGDLQRRVCQYLENDLFIEFGQGGYSTTVSLMEKGVLDSLALVRLLLWIEETFEVKLDFASLDPSEIDSVDKIVSHITERR